MNEDVNFTVSRRGLIFISVSFTIARLIEDGNVSQQLYQRSAIGISPFED